MTVESVKSQIQSSLDKAGLLSFVSLDESNFDQMFDEPSAEIVLKDASKQAQVFDVLRILKEESESGGERFDFMVRSHWEIESVGRPEPVYGSSGGLTAGISVPVTLRAGDAQVQVDVLVTKLAEMELTSILGQRIGLSEIARVHIEDLLRSSGPSSWDPVKTPYAEVNARTAPMLARSFRRTA